MDGSSVQATEDLSAAGKIDKMVSELNLEIDLEEEEERGDGEGDESEAAARRGRVDFLLQAGRSARTPYVPPEEAELFNYIGKSRRQLHQDLAKSGRPPHQASRVRRGNLGGPPAERREEHLGPPRRRKGGPATQPHTARDYLLTARATARDKHLARVAEVESRRLDKELHRERGINSELESQLMFHESALQEFLQHHYRQVSDALSKGEEARRNLTEQEVRIDYFSGLLAEAQTVQEEEEERLQELTAFQQFLSAVTPAQSLRDLKRRMQEVQDEVKASRGLSGGRRDSVLSLSSGSVDLSFAATLAAAANSRASSPIGGGEGGGGGSLGADLMSLRMTRLAPPTSRSSSRTGHRTGRTRSPEEVTDLELHEGAEVGEEETFDDHMDDHERLVDLAHVYESQCHSLLALLTRLRDQTEAINNEVQTRQKRLDSRLQEIQQLVDKAKGGGHESQLKDLCTLISEWPRLSDDAEAQSQLDQLVAQIAEVVSDVFGSSKYSPLVPQTDVENGNKKAPKGTNGSKSNSSMGQEALLALLEARVTDLCAQLDTIDPELRDSIFLNCEQARYARLKEEKRQETEMRRAERKQRHLERALADPPPKPL
ncbi:uncharacterized protein LOC122251506 [Penaeus japonicus]|uniref:uncharacterized protein LOC122251506 n=1 Tax=Penaeus japonicus TaxID=27405 RepID=UPI001C71654F|nr:uncharacterized protein LOC122251506 [Penaeus japonicus]